MIFQPQTLMRAGSVPIGAGGPPAAPPAAAPLPPPPVALPPRPPSQGTPSNLSLDHLLMLANLTNSATDWTVPPLSTSGTP